MWFKRYFLIALLSLGITGRCAAELPTKDTSGWYHEVRDLYYGIPVQFEFFPKRAQLADEVWAYLESMNDVFNDYRASSEIYTINRLDTAGEVTLSPMLADAFDKARQAWILSEGAFDITCAPIRNLWKQAVKTGLMPSDAEVAAAREHCGMNLAELDGTRLIRSQAGIQFDFGGMIKGMIADHVVGMLKAGGAQSALVQIGGETAVFGLSPKNRPFRIAVQHPEFRNGTWCVIQNPGTGLSASTSGNYENPIIINGQAFYHIMDMRTGRPVQTDVVSVSIAFPETGKNWLADTLSTTGVLLGPEKTFEVVQRLGGEAMFLIRTDGAIREVQSSGWGMFK